MVRVPGQVRLGFAEKRFGGGWRALRKRMVALLDRAVGSAQHVLRCRKCVLGLAIFLRAGRVLAGACQQVRLLLPDRGQLLIKAQRLRARLAVAQQCVGLSKALLGAVDGGAVAARGDGRAFNAAGQVCGFAAQVVGQRRRPLAGEERQIAQLDLDPGDVQAAAKALKLFERLKQRGQRFVVQAAAHQRGGAVRHAERCARWQPKLLECAAQLRELALRFLQVLALQVAPGQLELAFGALKRAAQRGRQIAGAAQQGLGARVLVLLLRGNGAHAQPAHGIGAVRRHHGCFDRVKHGGRLLVVAAHIQEDRLVDLGAARLRGGAGRLQLVGERRKLGEQLRLPILVQVGGQQAQPALKRRAAIGLRGQARQRGAKLRARLVELLCVEKCPTKRVRRCGLVGAAGAPRQRALRQPKGTARVAFGERCNTLKG